MPTLDVGRSEVRHGIGSGRSWSGWRHNPPALHPGADAVGSPLPDTACMTLTDYLLNAALISLVVLQIRGHKVTVVRLLTPVVLTIWGASQFLQAVPTSGGDVALEGCLVAVGCVLGVLAGLATGIHREGDGAVARAGGIAAILWVVGIGARVGFSLWVTHGGAGGRVRASAPRCT